MVKLWRYSGIFLIITGIFHNIVGLLIGWEVLLDIGTDGLINTVNTQHDRNAIFWFLFSGVFFILLGHFAHWFIKKEQKPVPRFVGWYLLITAIIGCIMSPVSGIWLFIPQAVIILTADISK